MTSPAASNLPHQLQVTKGKVETLKKAMEERRARRRARREAAKNSAAARHRGNTDTPRPVPWGERPRRKVRVRLRHRLFARGARLAETSRVRAGQARNTSSVTAS